MEPKLNARPIDHSATSAAGATVAGAGGGVIKGGLLSGAAWIIGLTALGAITGVAIATGGFGLGALSFLGSGSFWAGVVGGGVGLALAVPSSPFVATIGAAIGGLFGGAKASERVANERGAASVLQAQVEAYKAQAGAHVATVQAMQAAQAPIAANNNNKYDFPAQGEAMNPASTKIKTGADNAELHGAVAGQERQRA